MLNYFFTLSSEWKIKTELSWGFFETIPNISLFSRDQCSLLCHINRKVPTGFTPSRVWKLTEGGVVCSCLQSSVSVLEVRSSYQNLLQAFSVVLLVKMPINIILIPKAPINCNSDDLMLKMLTSVQGLAVKNMDEETEDYFLGTPKQKNTMLSSLVICIVPTEDVLKS